MPECIEVMAEALAQLTRGEATLPIGQVPGLRAGDKLVLKADLPADQAARYVLILAFLRGATNPPPKNWFFRADTWVPKKGTITATVPEGAEQAIALLAQAGAPVDNLQVMGEAGDAWHPGQSGTLRLGPKTVLAAFGMVHPWVLKAFDLDGAVAAVELYLDAIPPKRATGFMRPAYSPPALQSVKRDFAFLVPAELPADSLIRAVRGADKAAITAATALNGL